MQARTRRLALTEGVTAGILFGTAAIFIRFLQNVDGFSIAFWRLIIACLILSLTLFAFGKPFNLDSARKDLRSLLILGLFLGLHFIFFVFAVKDTTILNSTVLVNTAPLFSVFMSSFLFKLRPSRIAILGIAISFAGVCVIARAETLIAGVVQPGGFSANLKGDLEAILAAVVEAFYLSYGRKIRMQMDIFTSMVPIYLLAAIFVGVISIFVTGRTLTLSTEMVAIFLFLGLGLLPTAIAHTLYFSSLSNLKSFETATVALLEPVGATVLGVALFQETPAPLFILGALLILVGLFFVIKNGD